jgi:hypothetical protein
MKTPLVPIHTPSIYLVNGVRVPLPERMARCTPDTRRAIRDLGQAVAAQGGALYLSDLFRSYDVQLQSHLDWKSGKKKAKSPPPGGSLHEAGRAMDMDLDAIDMSLADFWGLAKAVGFFPIINAPKPKTSEAWHFDRRGSHDLVYEYYRSGKASNFVPYQAMAASAILATGERVDSFGHRQREAALQFGLVRLGFRLGNVDGAIGKKTLGAVEGAGIPSGDVEEMLIGVEHLLQERFAEEYRQEEMVSPADSPWTDVD